MDIEDRRRYFIVGSVIVEIVQPLFRTRLEKDYSSKGIGSLQAFLSTLPVIHILFHLRHRNAYCCKDNLNCRNNSKLPLIYCQWDLLYTENPAPLGHNCHCKFTANSVHLNELDLTLASLILLNCCRLGPSEENAVRNLRRYKNDYLSHNIEGSITETEYKSLWTDLTNFVLQLDPNKQDDLIRIENRPLDEGLCSRYSIDLLNIHKKLNEMGTQIQCISSGMQMMSPEIQGISSEMQRMGPQIQEISSDMQRMGPQIQEISSDMQRMCPQIQEISSDMQRMSPQIQGISSGMQVMSPQIQGIRSCLQDILSYQRNEANCHCCRKKLIHQGMDEREIDPYKLRNYMFYRHHQLDSKSLLHSCLRLCITDAVMMDDGRLVICLFCLCSILICNTDGSEVVIIPLNISPRCVTAVNNSTVAIIVSKIFGNKHIELYDINNKHKLKSISIPGIHKRSGIAMINDKLVVAVDKRLVMVDYQTGEIVGNIEINCIPEGIQASGSRILYRKYMQSKKEVYWYSFIDDEIHKSSLPSIPWSLTALGDGSLYILCTDGSLQHVSCNGKQFKTIRINGLKILNVWHFRLRYNLKQKKMLIYKSKNVKIFHETRNI